MAFELDPTKTHGVRRNFTVSNNGTVVNATGGGVNDNSWGGIACTDDCARSTGKWYWEQKIFSTADQYQWGGIINNDAIANPYSTFLGRDAAGDAYAADFTRLFHKNTNVGTIPTMWFTTNTTLFKLDLDLGTFEVLVTGDGTGTYVAFPAPPIDQSKTWVPSVGTLNNGQVQIFIKEEDLNYPVPVGYQSLDKQPIARIPTNKWYVQL